MKFSHIPVIFFLGFVLLLFPKKIFAATYYVATNGDNANSGTLNNPWRNINYAAGRLQAGDTFYIRGGTYQEQVVFSANGTQANPIVISGYPGETAIIDGNNWTIPTGENTKLVQINGNWNTIKNLEIRNAQSWGIATFGDYTTMDNLYVHHNKQNGLYVGANNCLVNNCRVYYNCYDNENGQAARAGRNWASGLTAGHDAGYNYKNKTIIQNSVIWDNWGEGLSTYDTDSVIMQDNVVYDNWAVQVYIQNASNGIIRRNLIYRTPQSVTGGHGGAEIGILVGEEAWTSHSATGNSFINNLVMGAYRNFYIGGSGSYTNLLVAYNTFVNSMTEGNVVFNSGSGSNSRFVNNIVLQEDGLPTGQISGVGGLTFFNNLWSKPSQSSAMSGAGDVIGNPKLAKTGQTGPGQLTAEWFKTLSSSPAINKAKALAEVTEDFFRNPRGSSPDIGAHEYGGVAPTISPAPSVSPTPPQNPADVNRDGKVNSSDMTLILSKWGTTASGIAEDINRDGKVNLFDAVIIVANWP